MKLIKLLVVSVAAFVMSPEGAKSQPYKESFECTFKRGLANRPTPSRIVFSVDKYGRSAVLHEIDISEIDTNPGSGRIKRDTPRVLSIEWVGNNYTFTETGFTYATNEARIDAIDLIDHQFSVRLDRKSMKATATSKSLSAYMPRDGYAKGNCISVASPKG